MARTTRRDGADQEKHKAKKVARTLTRLKFSLMADDLLNDLIPDIDDAVDLAIAESRDWSFDVAKLIEDAMGVALPALEDK
jgi:hypothetical protein